MPDERHGSTRRGALAGIGAVTFVGSVPLAFKLAGAGANQPSSAAATGSGPYAATRIMRNAGGFSIGINFADDGTAVQGGDVHGCYILSPNDPEWRPLLTTAIIPDGSYNGSFLPDSTERKQAVGIDATGCYAIAIAPSDSSRVYFTYNGRLFIYDDSTRRARLSGLPQKKLLSNSGDVRHWGFKMAVDPGNRDVLLFGTQGQSVFASTNGGLSFIDLAAPAGDRDTSGSNLPRPNLVAVDPSSPVSGTVHQRWYYSVNSEGSSGGIYESTSGPLGPYMQIPGSPRDCRFMRFDQTGRMWVCGSSLTYTFHHGGSFGPVAPLTGAFAVAVDPRDSKHIVATDGSSNLWSSFDNGSSWSRWSGDAHSPVVQTSRATDLSYLDTGPNHNRGGSCGVIAFNPAKANELWQSWGLSPRKCTPPLTSRGKFEWFERGKGIDMACCTSLIVPPGVGPIAGFLDLGTWKLVDFVNATNVPNQPQKATDDWTMRPPTIVQPTNALDFASDNPRHVVTLTTNGWWFGPQRDPHGGYSNDGGKTYAMFPTQVPDEPAYPGSNFGGCMAVGPEGCAIVAWGAKRAPHYTKDGYRTWAVLPFPNLPPDGIENGIGDWSNGYFSKKNICYDKTGGAYYLYDYGPSGDHSKAGIWKSVDKGDSWTQIYAGTLPLGVYHCRLRAVPGRAGELFFVAGAGQNTPIVKLTDAMNGKMKLSPVAHTAYVTDVAFAKSDPGGKFPLVLAFGLIDNQWGYHLSHDYCASWTHLGYIDGWMDWPKVLQGDPDNPGVFYAGMAASGVRRIARRIA